MHTTLSSLVSATGSTCVIHTTYTSVAILPRAAFVLKFVLPKAVMSAVPHGFPPRAPWFAVPKRLPIFLRHLRDHGPSYVSATAVFRRDAAVRPGTAAVAGAYIAEQNTEDRRMWLDHILEYADFYPHRAADIIHYINVNRRANHRIAEDIVRARMTLIIDEHGTIHV